MAEAGRAEAMVEGAMEEAMAAGAKVGETKVASAQQ